MNLQKQSLSQGRDKPPSLPPSIESDGVLFFLSKIIISANNTYIIGPTWGKIGVSGVKTETLCHALIKAFVNS